MCTSASVSPPVNRLSLTAASRADDDTLGAIGSDRLLADLHVKVLCMYGSTATDMRGEKWSDCLVATLLVKVFCKYGSIVTYIHSDVLSYSLALICRRAHKYGSTDTDMHWWCTVRQPISYTAMEVSYQYGSTVTYIHDGALSHCLLAILL